MSTGASPVVSIDTPEFRALMCEFKQAGQTVAQGQLSPAETKFVELIAHIDAAMAQHGQERYEAGKQEREASTQELVRNLGARMYEAEASLARLVAGVQDVAAWQRPARGHLTDSKNRTEEFVLRADLLALLPAKAEQTDLQVDEKCAHEEMAQLAADAGHPFAPAPATGEELPPLPESDHSRGDGIPGGPYHFYTADQMHDYGRACMALRQPGAEKPHCPHCGKHEIDMARTCHNSACESYARAEVIYEGWKLATTAPASFCPDCKGTGEVDSGGIHPWGEAAMMPCGCDSSIAAPGATGQAKWTGDDSEALHHLGQNFTNTAGLLQPKEGYSPTPKDFAAIDYLCNEWDYAYEPQPATAPVSQPALPEPALSDAVLAEFNRLRAIPKTPGFCNGTKYTQQEAMAMALAAASQPAAQELHAAIMNLPAKPDEEWPGGEQHAYKLGHRDARHAAAELVAFILDDKNAEDQCPICQSDAVTHHRTCCDCGTDYANAEDLRKNATAPQPITAPAGSEQEGVCAKCGDVLPPGKYCKGAGCPLNPALAAQQKNGAAK